MEFAPGEKSFEERLEEIRTIVEGNLHPTEVMEIHRVLRDLMAQAETMSEDAKDQVYDLFQNFQTKIFYLSKSDSAQAGEFAQLHQQLE